jgi:hypothetical protein
VNFRSYVYLFFNTGAFGIVQNNNDQNLNNKNDDLLFNNLTLFNNIDVEKTEKEWFIIM